MNISRLSSVSANAQPASVRPFHSTTKASEAPERRAEVAESRGHEHSRRVSNFASQIETRLQGAIENGNLSEGQIQGLKDAAAQFQSLMNRIGSAEFSNSPERQVLFALDQLGNQMQKVLHPDDHSQNTPVRGGEAAGAMSAPTTMPSVDAVA
jgi:hypothetical protein